jgi:hypothetical protein
VLRKDVLTLNAEQRAQAREAIARRHGAPEASPTSARAMGRLSAALQRTESYQERAERYLTSALATVARMPEPTSRAERRHALRALASFHPQLTDEQRTELAGHAGRLAAHPPARRLAAALGRIAELSPATPERPAPERTAAPARTAAAPARTAAAAPERATPTPPDRARSLFRER